MSQTKSESDLLALTNLQSEVEGEMLCDLLQQAEIPVVMQDGYAAGNYLKLYMGFSVYGETLYVRREDYARAQELLLALRQNSEAAIQAEQPEALNDADAFDQQEARTVPWKKTAWPGIVIFLIAVFAILWGIH